MIICESSQKPLMLFHLVHFHSVNNALVFTKSAESTNRLVRLMNFLENSFARDKGPSHKKTTVCAYSSDLAPSERKSILEKFKAQEIDMYARVPFRMTAQLTMIRSLVCSDLISRGIDISHVSHVVSYDVPVDIRKYVHRVGRTARAGRHGEAWTLVEEQEVRQSERPRHPWLTNKQARYFKSMMKEADHLERLKRLRIGEDKLAPLLPCYEVSTWPPRHCHGLNASFRLHLHS